MSLEVNRVEEKYLLTCLQAKQLRNRLKNVLPGDAFNGYKPYPVRSVYFDSYYDDDYYDKLAGVQLRKKVRLRTYATGSDKAKLEIKQKDDANQCKRSLTVTRQEAEALIAGDHSFLKDREEEYARQLFYIFEKEVYRPKSLVEYRRVAFEGPANNIRITFDSDVRASEGCFDLFGEHTKALRPVQETNQVVLEVKYNHFLLSYIKDILATVDVPQESFSKYVVGRYYGLLG